MNPNINTTSAAIALSRGKHRGNAIIWLQFRGRPTWLQQIKTLQNARYSRSNRCWYLPYDVVAYNNFLKLRIPYIITGTHDAAPKGVAIDESASKHDHTGISDTVGASARPSTDEVGADIHPTVNVEWHNMKFTITLDYSHDAVEKIKNLEGAWWHSASKQWICKGTISNLEKIQTYWQVWDKDNYANWYNMVATANHPCKIRLYHSPALPGKAKVAIHGHGANHQIIKRICRRQYSKRDRCYVIDYNRPVLDELIAAYRDIGYAIENRLPDYLKETSHISSRVKQISHFINKIDPSYYSSLKFYTEYMLRMNYGISTIRHYTGRLIRLMEWSQVEHMSDISPRRVNRYLNELATTGVSHSLINQVYSAVKLYYDKVDEGTGFELDQIQRPKKKYRLPNFVTESEIIRIIDQIDNVKHLAIVYFLYGTGMRRGELLALEIKDVLWDRNQILIRNGKGQKDRMVNLSVEMKRILEVYIENYQPARYVFESRIPGKPYSPSSVRSILRSACQKAGISRRITPHALRHSFATHLMDHGVAIPRIQALLGHKDIKTTLIYTHLTNQSMKDVESPLDRLIKKRNNGIEK